MNEHSLTLPAPATPATATAAASTARRRSSKETAAAAAVVGAAAAAASAAAAAALAVLNPTGRRSGRVQKTQTLGNQGTEEEEGKEGEILASGS